MKHLISEIEISFHPNKMKSGRKILSSRDAYEAFLETWNRNTIELYEEYKIMLLNNSSEILGIYTASKGGMTGTVVDLRIIFATILKSGATAFIAAHNHPSGKLKASNPDISLHKKIKKTCEFLDLSYLDNLIITPEGFLSFMDDGLN